ncbi:hypothetical protein M407DRAFT_6061 [Tulasnella calospora MUT 4182]|uniref:Uncharacterized protein n=1 Tax=Tulasnella calospora MUT 4182 TaxID=1051891 RepID=A0A0C3L6Z1_9AGAM|nr:hypothetical protein M407DRAFT_6061 [Tulasnella calospora MUT 4182]
MSIRKYTQHTLEDTGPSSALWKVIHAVLNASPEGRLGTREVENAIRMHFPKQRFTKSNINYSLSHSGDFKLVGSAGKSPRRWILTGKSDGVKRRGVMSIRHTPTKFDRTNTHFTLDYVASQPGSVATWKMCHCVDLYDASAVLNASPDGCFSTKEMKEALDLHYPDRMIKSSTLSYNLTQSEDFKQVYLEGEAPGRWFLTGKVKGVNRTNAVRAIKSCGASGMLSAGDDDHSDEDDCNEDDEDDEGDEKTISARRDTPPAAELPYPSKTEEIEAQYSPDLTCSSPTLPSSLPTSTTIALGSLPLSDARKGVNPTQPMRSQRGANSLSKDHLVRNTSFPPTQAPGSISLWEPNSVQSYLPNSLSSENLRSNTIDIPNHTGAFLRATSPTSFLQDDYVWVDASGEFLIAGNTQNTTTKPVYYTTLTDQQGAPNAHRMMMYPSYSETNTPRSDSYDSSAGFGAKIALGNTQPDWGVTTAGPPCGETSPYLLFQPGA